MAQGQPNMPSVNKHVVNIVRDAKGNVIFAIGESELVEFHTDGSATKYQINENQVLGDGLVYNASMGRGQHPVALLAVCGICGIPCSLRRGCSCPGCGRFLCPRHAVLCQDGRRRCERCSCFHSIKRGLRHIFFRLEEE